jgi:hypothetical protein
MFLVSCVCIDFDATFVFSSFYRTEAFFIIIIVKLRTTIEIIIVIIILIKCPLSFCSPRALGKGFIKDGGD